MGKAEIPRLLEVDDPEILSDQQAELERVVRRGLQPLRVPRPARLSVWAEQNFYLSGESSYVEGRWRCWPVQRSLMDCIGNDDIEIIDWMKSKRVGYTKILLAALAYNAEHKRRNQLLYQPTDDDRDEFVTTELEPMLRDVAAVRRVFPKFNRKSKDNTLRTKKFLTGLLHLRGGKAAKNYRRLTVDCVFYDELDAFDRDVEKEGTATKLGDGRLEGATFPKSVRGTTPKKKNHSNIEDCVAEADLRFRCHVPCKHCDEFIPIEWGGKKVRHGMKWKHGEPDTVHHVCRECGASMTQAEYFQVWERCRWVAEDGSWIDDECRRRSRDGSVLPWPRHIAFHIWAGYSPQATWPGIVREFLSANEKAQRGDTSELKTFINTVLGETYEERSEAADEHELMKRARTETYKLRTVPTGCLLLTAGVDVQDNRFEIGVWGWGRHEESWVVEQEVLSANPADERDWAKLDAYLQSRFRQQWHGGLMGIEAVAIDTGGHFTHQVYNFVRQREHRRVFGVRGSNRYGGPIKGTAHRQDVNWRGQVLRAGVKVWEVGTDTAKDLIHGRLRVMQPGPGYIHFSPDLPHEFFEQFTAEGRVLQKTSRGEEYRWVKRRQRNETLDTAVYAIFAAHAIDVHRYTDRMWQKIEDAVQPPPDLFAPQLIDVESTPAAAVHVSAQKPAEQIVPRASPSDPRAGFTRQW